MIRNLLRGYGVFFNNLIVATFWYITVTAPMIVVRVIFPDQFEAGADGRWFAWGVMLMIMLVWLPFASYTMGKMCFENIKDRAASDPTTDEEQQV